jgi:hypothetical protein
MIRKDYAIFLTCLTCLALSSVGCWATVGPERPRHAEYDHDHHDEDHHDHHDNDRH